MIRQIVLDTETTGIGAEHGHKIIEIGCVELIDRRLTGNHFHVYLNPKRLVDAGAFKVHGISDAFLKDKPLFEDILEDFLGYVRGAELIIHNATFDMGFLNAELKHCKHPKNLNQYCSVFDTLVYARDKHPGQRNSLDALCKRYDVDNSNRALHGALLDAEILASVYLAMTGGQASFFADDKPKRAKAGAVVENIIPLSAKTDIIFANEDELREHQAFVKLLEKKSGVNRWEDALVEVAL